MKNTLKNILIVVYASLFTVFFKTLNLFPLKDKITFVVAFGDNSLYLYDALKTKTPSTEIVFLCKKSAIIKKETLKNSTYIPFETSNLWNELRSIYHLATSRTVIVDSYFGFLASVRFKEDVECIQVWHAVGAFKQFALKDHSITKRTDTDLKRFKKVYDKFEKVVVGSESMSEIFQEAFGLPESRMLKLGVPRSDLFFNEESKRKIIQSLHKKIPLVKGKKVILYAPTFRDNELSRFQLELDVNKLLHSLGEDYLLLLKLHPAIQTKENDILNDRCINVSDYVDINHLLLITDILISDYSSVPFEYALLNRPIIFYSYDLAQYKQVRGLWADYENEVPGPLVYTTNEVIRVIKSEEYSLNKIRDFAEKWNHYSTGNASENLANYILKKSLDTQ